MQPTLNRLHHEPLVRLSGDAGGQRDPMVRRPAKPVPVFLLELSYQWTEKGN